MALATTDATIKAAYDQFTSRVAVSNYTAAKMAIAPTDYAISTSFQSLSMNLGYHSSKPEALKH